jgi:hypothetical protein
MRKLLLFLTIAALTAALPVAFAGDITGKITLKGTPPANPELKRLAEDVNCGKIVIEKVFMPLYVVGSGGELADVLVTIKDMSGKSTGASAEPAVIDQKGCQYHPYVSAVQTKQTVLVRNSDPLIHNVNITPVPGSGNKPHNDAQIQGSGDLKYTFDAPEKFMRFKCDVHEWMFAYLCVVDHPYFAVSGKDGTFKIKDVPPGKYTIEATHRKAGTVSKEVEVKDGMVNLDLTLEVK